MSAAGQFRHCPFVRFKSASFVPRGPYCEKVPKVV
jgi:hypothetical protein